MELQQLIEKRFDDNPYESSAEPDFGTMFADYPLPPELRCEGLIFEGEYTDPYERTYTEYIKYSKNGRIEQVLSLYNFVDRDISGKMVRSHAEIITYYGKTVNRFTSVRIYEYLGGSGVYFLVGEVEGLIEGLPSPTIDCLADMLSKIKFNLIKSVFPDFVLNRVVYIRHQCLLEKLRGQQSRCSHYECGNKSLFKCITNYNTPRAIRSIVKNTRLQCIDRAIKASRFI